MTNNLEDEKQSPFSIKNDSKQPLRLLLSDSYWYIEAYLERVARFKISELDNNDIIRVISGQFEVTESKCNLFIDNNYRWETNFKSQKSRKSWHMRYANSKFIEWDKEYQPRAFKVSKCKIFSFN